MKRMILLAIALAAMFNTLQAQVQVDTVWTRTFSGLSANTDVARGCSVDSTGYIIVAGAIRNYVNEDFITIKYNTNGDTIWARTFGDSSSIDKAFSCSIDKSSNIIVTGSMNNSGDILTIKYTPSGDTVWTRSYASPYGSDDEAYGSAVDSAGNVYIVGKSFSGAGFDVILIKYNSNGDTIWTRRYRSTGSTDDLAFGCSMSGDSILYVIGTCGIAGQNYPLILKYDQNGDTLWSRRLPYDAIMRGCSVDEIGNIYVTGSGTNPFMAKYNAAGDTLWSRLGAGGMALTVDKLGNVYQLGGGGDIVTKKYSSSGDTIWTQTYNGPANGNDAGYSLATNGGDVYIAGSSSNGTDEDILLIKYSQSLFKPITISPSNDTAYTINNPTFLWHPVDSATSYRLQISPFSNFASLTYNQTSTDTTQTSSALPDNWYYWRVKAYNSIDSSEWSEVRQFSVATATLPAPALLFPPADTVTNDSLPDFDWSDVGGATKYQLQVAKGTRWAWCANGYSGVYVLNASDSSAIGNINSASYNNIHQMVLRDTLLFICRYDRIYIVNVANPYASSLSSPLSTYTWNNSGAAVYDTILYVGSQNKGLRTVNIANPAAPVEIGSCDTTVTVSDLKVAGGLVYMLANGYLKVVDVSNPASPAILGTLPMSSAVALDVAGSYVYTASGTTGLQVVDVSDPAAPKLKGTRYTSGSFQRLKVAGAYAYVAASNGGLRVINISDENNPDEFGSYVGADYAYDVDLAGHYAYVSDYYNGLVLIDISDPHNPVRDTTYSMYNIETAIVADNFAAIEEDTVVALSSCAADTFVGDGRHYWRAKAGAGAWGPYSASRRFIMDTQPPSKTWHNSPSTNQLINDPTPVLDYNDIADAWRYQVQVCRDSAFAVLELDTLVSAGACTLLTALGDGRHWWHVRARDLAGNWANWSDSTYFRLDTQAPGAPTAVTANGDNPSQWTKTNSFAISFTAPVDSSGILNYCFKLGSAPSSNYDTTGVGYLSLLYPANTVVVPDVGVTPFYFWALDNAGNLDYRNYARIDLRFDSIPPVGAWARSNEFSRTNSFNVSWNAGSDLGGSGLNNKYRIRVKINPAGSWADTLMNYSGTQWTYTGANNNKYYFQVAALDSAGNNEAFTTAAECSTLVDNTITCPILVSPYNGLIRDSAATAFLWQRATAQTGARLQCAFDPGFIALAKDTVLATDSTVTLTLADSLYYWRAQGWNSASDTSSWSPARTLRIDTQAPAAPFLSSPGPDTLTSNNRPDFVWKPEAGAARYRLQIGADSLLASPLRDVVLDSTAYTPDVTLSDSVWYWRVKAGDAAGNWSPWSEQWALTIDTRAPAVPFLVLPADGAALVTALPQFLWNASATAASYRLQVADNTSFTTPQLDTMVADTFVTPALGLSDGVHYWRVFSRDSAGNESAWCAYRSFSINALLQVTGTIPGSGQLWAPGSAVWITFTKPVLASHIDTLHIMVSGKFTPRINRYFTYDNPSRTLKIAPDTAFASLDSVTVTLSGSIYDANSTTTLDGNNNGTAAGDSTDNYRLTFVTSWVGDFNRDLAVGGADLAMFVAAWYAPYDRYYEAGPVSGAWPHQQVIVGNSTKLDFEDISGFIYSWNRADGTKQDGQAKGGPLALRAGAAGTVEIELAQGTAFAALDAELDFDPAVLALREIAPAALWNEPGRPQLFLNRQKNGRCAVSAARWQSGEAAGSLFTARFDAAQQGPAEVILRYTLYDARGSALGSGRETVQWSAAPGLPSSFAMGRASPNPTTRSARIQYQLPAQSQVRLEVYNITGQRVATIVNEQQPAGYYAPVWDLKDSDGRRVGGGVYFYRLTAGPHRAVGKVTVIK